MAKCPKCGKIGLEKDKYGLWEDMSISIKGESKFQKPHHCDVTQGDD